jgi:hypothetical protein
MDNISTKQSRRTLGVRSGFEARAATLGDEQREFHLKQQAAEQQTPRRSEAAGKPSRDGKAITPLSQAFETKCLLVVLAPDRANPDSPRRYCAHVRGNSELVGHLMASFDARGPLPALQQRIEAAGTVCMRNSGSADRPPLASLRVTHWSPK